MKIVIIGGTRLIGSEVVADPKALCFGAALEPNSLLPAAGARLGGLNFQAWFARSAFARQGAVK